MFGLGHPFGQQKFLPPIAGALPQAIKGGTSTEMFSKELVRGNPTKQTLTIEGDEAIDGRPDYLDILMGRAKNSQKHSGNLIFQKLILANIKTYTKNSRGGKGHVVKSLLTFLRDEKKVRFLKRLECGSYVQILDTKVLNDKVSHALRDVQFSDETQYCPPEAEDIVKEFEEYTLALENGAETSAEKKVNITPVTDKQIRHVIYTDHSTLENNRATERDQERVVDRHVAHQSELRKESDALKSIVNPFNHHMTIDDTSIVQQPKVSANLAKLTEHRLVDLYEAENKGDKVPHILAPRISPPTIQCVLQGFYQNNPSQSPFPSMASPVGLSRITANISLLTSSDQLHLEEICRAHQERSHNQLEQLRAQGRAHSQFEQFLAHDQLQMQQLRTAQEARRNRLCLSRATDPVQSFVTRQPLSSDSCQELAPPSSTLTTISQSTPKNLNTPLSGIELLSNVVDVLTMGSPLTHVDENIPSQVFSSQSPATLNVAYSMSIPNTLGTFGALHSSCQTQNSLPNGSIMALPQWTGGLNSMRVDQPVLGHGPGDPKKRRIGEYSFL